VSTFCSYGPQNMQLRRANAWSTHAQDGAYGRMGMASEEENLQRTAQRTMTLLHIVSL
jgi:hypothetical protein